MLSRIAQAIYDNVYRLWYMKIFEANRDKLQNPDLIRPGQVLTIPYDPSDGRMMPERLAAIAHGTNSGQIQVVCPEQECPEGIKERQTLSKTAYDAIVRYKAEGKIEDKEEAQEATHRLRQIASDLVITVPHREQLDNGYQ